MKIQKVAPSDVFYALRTSDRGLSPSEALKRIREYGPNEVKEVGKRSLFRSFISQFTHLLALLLWVAAGLCFFTNLFHPQEGMLHLGWAIIGVILINALFSFFQELRAEKMLDALKKLLPAQAVVMREGDIQEIPFNAIVPGDVLILKAGDLIPADARIVEANHLMVNNAVLTGESEFQARNHLPFEGHPLESSNLVFAGTVVVSGEATAVTYATGLATELGKIAHLVKKISEEKTPLQLEIIRLTKILSFLTLTTGLVFFALGVMIGRSFWQNLLFGIGILIAFVPEGLLPTVTLSLAMAAQRMAKKNALIKTLNSVETLGSVTVICSDKTGTLTQNIMKVVEVWTEDRQWLMTIGRLCTTATQKNGECVGNPTETAILEAAEAEVGELRAKKLKKLPFDSERKRMSTLHQIDQKGWVLAKGAAENLLPLCTHVATRMGIQELTNGKREEISQEHERMTQKGLRVIAFAFKEAPIDQEIMMESNLVFAGFMGLEDPPRPEVPEAIAKCLEGGIKIIMVTGDAPATAVAIAKQIGLIRNSPAVLTGNELDALSNHELLSKLASQEVILARMNPLHKMRVVKVLEDAGERVAVTGDGVNDAPALKKAHVGIAMGKTGTDVAREASDIILLDDNFSTIVSAVEEGRAVFQNIRKFISYIFASNIPEIVPYLAFILFKIPLPLTILQILAIDLGTDLFPALALGAEKPAPQIMKEPPRSPDEKLLDRGLLIRSFLFLGMIEACAGLFAFFYILKDGGWHWGESLPASSSLYLTATTACLAAIVITQLGNFFACRTFKESAFKIKPFINKILLFSLALEIVIASGIIYTPFGNAIFKTAPVKLSLFWILIPFGIFLLGAEEARKWILRIRQQRGAKN